MDEILNLIESVSEGFPSYFGQPTTGMLSLLFSNKWVTASNQGSIRQRKESDGLHLQYVVPEIR